MDCYGLIFHTSTISVGTIAYNAKFEKKIGPASLKIVFFIVLQ
jgi:hypothetical protein